MDNRFTNMTDEQYNAIKKDIKELSSIVDQYDALKAKSAEQREVETLSAELERLSGEHRRLAVQPSENYTRIHQINQRLSEIEARMQQLQPPPKEKHTGFVFVNGKFIDASEFDQEA